jgi:hypothetical protein
MKLRLGTLLLLLLLWAAPAFGQGCAMCYSSARAATESGQRAISRGVIVLLVPPVGFMIFGAGLAFRYGKKRDEEQEADRDPF